MNVDEESIPATLGGDHSKLGNFYPCSIFQMTADDQSVNEESYSRYGEDYRDEVAHTQLNLSPKTKRLL
jgi:hypothetical protein